MSLAFPINIAARSERAELVHSLLNSAPGPLTCQIDDGRFASHSIGPSEVEDVASRVADCSIEYVLDSSRNGLQLPVAAFVCNEGLRVAKLQYLIDDIPNSDQTRIPRQTVEMLGVFIRSLFDENRWIESVIVPANVYLLGRLFGMTAETDGSTRITLPDGRHRPQSGRRFT